ncbi:MAG: SPOR domain-containing protein [Bacteroidetes bacterium]|nr:SPOR domain-containing protein [Bacteroidota bacterium]
MLAFLLALNLSSPADTVVVGAGVSIDEAVRATVGSGAHQAKQSVDPGAERYTVQVYAGRRQDANAVYVQLSDSIGSSMPVVIHFDEPQFKVFVGIYGSRLEAEYALRKWRGRYPTAFAVLAPNQRFKKGSSTR